MKTKVEILQGHQIGGCITIISTEQMKLVIDFGESLPGTDNVSNVDFDWQNENVSGVFFTHYHGDHIGRMEEIPEDIPIYMGEVTYKVMLNIYQALSRHDDNMAKKAEWLRNRKNIFFIQPDKEERIGDMIVTPYSVDHSAFDSYMFLVHAYDEYILHTGDYRDHGHRGYVKGRNIPLAVIQKYITRYGRRKINMLITEGTTLTRSGLSRYTEKDMLRDADAFFRENKYIFLKISSTNVDSLASFAVAAQRNGMKMYVNGYLKAQIKIYQKASIKYNTKMYMFNNVEKFISAESSDYQERTAF